MVGGVPVCAARTRCILTAPEPEFTPQLPRGPLSFKVWGSLCLGFCLPLPSAERRLPDLCKPCLATGFGEGGQVFPHRHRTFQRLHNLPERQRWGAQPLLSAVAGSIPPLALGGHPSASQLGSALHLIGRNAFLGGTKEQVQSAGESLVQAFCVPLMCILPLSTPARGECPAWTGAAGFEQTWAQGNEVGLSFVLL